MICKKCSHRYVCKHVESYSNQISKINISKLDKNFVEVKATCLYYHRQYDGNLNYDYEMIYKQDDNFIRTNSKLEESLNVR